MTTDKRTEKRRTGDLGEDIACRYLREKGHVIVERNYLKPFGEIDIVSRYRGDLYLTEVKTVSRPFVSRETVPHDDYRPEDNIHKDKVLRLSRAISVYLEERRVPESVEWNVAFMTVKMDKTNRKAVVSFMTNMAL